MAQIFHRSTNTFSRFSIFGSVFILGFLTWAFSELNHSDYSTRARTPVDQPVPFSHEHHVGGLGIDCRYCHTTVETSSFANIPPTKTCMNCHSQIWNTSPTLEPVRDSFRTDRSIRWIKVHDLPDYVYFNHSIHVNKGVGCTTCHGPVNRMPLTVAARLAANGMVSRVPPQSGALRAAEVGGVQRGVETAGRSGRDGTQAGGGIQDSEFDQLFDVSPMSKAYEYLDLEAIRRRLEAEPRAAVLAQPGRAGPERWLSGFPAA